MMERSKVNYNIKYNYTREHRRKQRPSLKRETAIKSECSFDLVDLNTIYNKIIKSFLLIEVHVYPLPFLIDFILMLKIKKLQTFR